MNEEEINNYTDSREDVSICQVHTDPLQFNFLLKHFLYSKVFFDLSPDVAGGIIGRAL